MEDEVIQGKTPLKKSWTRWIILGLVGLLLILAIIWAVMFFIVHPKGSGELKDQGGNSVSSSNQDQNDTKQMTNAQIQTANAAISKGVSIDDPQNDWFKFPAGSVEGDGRPDNSNSYPLPYTDVKNASFGAADNYFYIKYTFYEKIPETMQNYNADDIKMYTSNIGLSKYTNAAGQTENGEWQLGMAYIRGKNNDSLERSTDYTTVTPYMWITNMGEQTGTDSTSESIWKIQNSKGLTAGGPGNDWIMAAFPLDNLGMKMGDTIEFSLSVETASRIYHHQSVDLVLGKGSNKQGDTIRYVLGSNTYEDIGFHMEAGKN